MAKYFLKTAVLVGLVLFGFSSLGYSQDSRIKDLVNVRGNRPNQLIGFGLIMGLPSTGDSPKSLAKNRALANLMNRLGVQLQADEVTAASAAAVIVTADLPGFTRNGDRIDVKVSSVGDAKSLAGGTLLMTPLKAGDGQVYVVAQGSVVVGQASGKGPSVLTTAMVPQGGIVEREFSPNIAPQGKVILSLRSGDFTTASRISDAINTYFKGFFAQALDPVSVSVDVPPLYQTRIAEFLSDLENIKVVPDQRAVVVLNERTGTVVIGRDTQISQVSIAHGSLSIQVGTSSEPAKSGSKNAAGASSSSQKVVNMGGSTVGQLVDSLNALGVKPADLVGIFQSIHAAGALNADLKFL